MISPMVSTKEAREILGVSRKLFDKIKSELRGHQYVPNGKNFYKRAEIDAFIERHRKPTYVHGQLQNPEIAGWFN